MTPDKHWRVSTLLADNHYGGYSLGDIRISWIAPAGDDMTFYVQLPGELTGTPLTPAQLRHLAIVANAALASMPQAASASTEDSASLPRSGDD